MGWGRFLRGIGRGSGRGDAQWLRLGLRDVGGLGIESVGIRWIDLPIHSPSP